MSSLNSAFLAANRGPLTTIYTPPASCLSTTTISTFMVTNNGTVDAQKNIFIGHYLWGDAACYPPTIAIDPVSKTELWANNYYYSPGICPSGWYSACTQTANPAGFPTTFASGTNAALCCPSSYACFEYGDNSWSSHGCTRIVQGGTPITPAWIPTQSYPSDMPFSPPPSLSITYTGYSDDETVYCDGIPIIWQDSDVSLFSHEPGAVKTTASQPSATNQPGTISQLNSPISTTMSTSASTDASNGLSTATKVAIGVCIPLSCFALVLGTFFIMRYHNKRALQAYSNNKCNRREAYNEFGSTFINNTALRENTTNNIHI